MGHIFNFQDVKAYQAWCNSSTNEVAIRREMRLMVELLKPMRGRCVLDIGCGTGNVLARLLELGLSVTGIDPSPYMLDAATAALGNRADLHRASAEDLPFDDNAFNYVCLVNTLEFTDSPKQAMAEACRVAKDRVYIGVMNRHTIHKIQRGMNKDYVPSFINKARYVGIREIKKTIHQLLGDVPVSWRTLRNIPIASEKISACLEKSFLLRQCFFPEYTGIVITPIPQFKTRPLQVTCTATPGTGGVMG